MANAAPKKRPMKSKKNGIKHAKRIADGNGLKFQASSATAPNVSPNVDLYKSYPLVLTFSLTSKPKLMLAILSTK